ncbi:MAG: DNA-binding protein [Lachnospiraceae bacterium]|nr:DNA-binding protein [Lachnospiraceae bacterium]
MEKILEQTLLYDFYGELLTKHQREVYEDVVLGDLGYSEAAEELGVSRQGVHDLVKRVDRQLRGYEEKLGLVERFLDIRSEIIQIREMADKGRLDSEDAARTAAICDRILSQL